MQENKQKWEKEFDEFIARATESIKISNGGGHDYCNVCGVSPSKLKQYITDNFISREELKEVLEEIEKEIQNERYSGAPYLGNKIKTMIKDKFNL